MKTLTFFVTIFTITHWILSDHIQERAKVIFTNPKYLKDVSIFTFRAKRNAPYLTNFNFTSLYTFGNNVSVTVEFQNAKDIRLNLAYKLCDYITIQWLREFILGHSNAPANCPMPPGRYIFTGMELPPKNMPISLMPDDFKSYLTATLNTGEKILQTSVALKYGKEYKSKGK